MSKIIRIEVINMCSSFDFIEQQAFEMSEKIRKESIYKFVGVEVSESSSLGSKLEHANGLVQQSASNVSFITKVILEDEEGATYSVEPTPDGLRFAKGEITYMEYGKRKKRETFNVVSFFFVAVGFICLAMWTVKVYII